MTYPSKPVRLLIPFAPGGGADILNRLIAQRLSETTGQSIIADNRPGADGVVATEIAARSPADGYTLLVVTLSFAINPAIGRKLPYDPVGDFTAISQTASQQIILIVHPSLPVKSVKDLINYAKSKPGGLNYGSSSNAGQLPMELFNSMVGLKMVHVPYKGSAPMLNDLLAGQIQLTFGGALASMPHVKAGKLRALAIGDSKRSPLLPDLPTIAESGLPGYKALQWMGLVAPAKTPRAIIDRVNQEVVRIVQSAEVRERLLQIGNEPVGSAAAQFGVFIKAEIAKWAKIAKEAGIKPDS
ncbi:MAG: tripartite tricarboxylate transporter substrate binding protein [Betaproteobacteria bacterium]|nr:tripartite tricarboxylate transporter substrate binding protein [Betaproteobacteria bacterium]